jgi:hypothetical protein
MGVFKRSKKMRKGVKINYVRYVENNIIFL